MGTKLATLALIAAVTATPALARDTTGFHAIAAGDLGAAEQTLKAERRIYPQRPELMLNLAFVYARTGRVAEASALYRAVLSRDEVMLETPAGAEASSHAIATAGLGRVADRPALQTAAR